MWCQIRDVTLTIQFVPGKLNVVADLLIRSYQILQTERTITHNAFCPLWELWVKPIFRSFRHSVHSPFARVCRPSQGSSYFGHSHGRGVDAYAFPPIVLISRVLAILLRPAVGLWNSCPSSDSFSLRLGCAPDRLRAALSWLSEPKVSVLGALP